LSEIEGKVNSARDTVEVQVTKRDSAVVWFLTSNFRSTSGQLPVNFRSTSGQLPVNFRWRPWMYSPLRSSLEVKVFAP
jgi:hypothetical protein